MVVFYGYICADKKIVLVAALAVLSMNKMNAQESTFFDKVSLEAAYGFNLALSPDNVDRTDVSGLNTIQLAANYQLNNVWGIRGTYSNTTFKHKDNKDLGINYNKLTAEATYQILQAINPEILKFDVMAHAGFGLNFGKSKVADVTDTMGNFQIGLKPQYNVSNRVGIFLDGKYIMNFSQNLGYNGLNIVGEESTTGSYATGLLGVTVKLGK